MPQKNENITSSASAAADFRKIFEQLSARNSYSETFNNFLDFALYMYKLKKYEDDIANMKRLESIYTTKQEAEWMSELLAKFSIASDNDGQGFHDALGDLFMDLVSHGKNGQFFTPMPVCEMMARILHGDDLKKGMTVSDPACGSGRMLLAMGKIERQLEFYGADNDLTCCKMAVLNMFINTMEGEIAWMDSLSMEHYKSWHIRKVLTGSHYMPYLFTSGKNKSIFIQRSAQKENASETAADEEVKIPAEQKINTGWVDVKYSSKRENQLSLFENSGHEVKSENERNEK